MELVLPGNGQNPEGLPDGSGYPAKGSVVPIEDGIVAGSSGQPGLQSGYVQKDESP